MGRSRFHRQLIADFQMEALNIEGPASGPKSEPHNNAVFP